MMKKTLIASTIALLTTFAGAASASTGVYVAGDLGTSIMSTRDVNTTATVSQTGLTEPFSFDFKNKNKSVFGGGVAVGYDFYDQFQAPVRVEVAAKFRGDAKNSQSFDVGSSSLELKNKVRMDTYMVNGYYDFRNASGFTPYVTTGIGLAHLKSTQSFADTIEVSGDANNFAWGVGAGVKYDITSNFSIDASYRYIDGGKVTGNKTVPDGSGTISVKTSSKVASNDLMLGVAYKF
ncbi:outer membrane protein [Kluyvera sichuanensis]